MADDNFDLYDLRVEVVATDRPMVCGHREGDWFLVQGEDLVFPQTRRFSMYALAAVQGLCTALLCLIDPGRKLFNFSWSSIGLRLIPMSYSYRIYKAKKIRRWRALSAADASDLIWTIETEGRAKHEASK